MVYPFIFYFALRFVHEEDALDFTAEAFYKLWKHDKPFLRLQGVKLFLQVTVRNACINHLRLQKYREGKKKEIFFLSKDATQWDDDDVMIEAKSLARVYAEIEKLPKEAKKVIHLAYIDGLNNEKIAAHLKLSINTVMSQKARAIKILRIALLNTQFALFAIILF